VLINSKLIYWYNVMIAPKRNRVTLPKILVSNTRKFPIVEIVKKTKNLHRKSRPYAFPELGTTGGIPKISACHPS
jgi:hypothetical protein